jgi:GDP-L-fucose synthase
MDFVFHLVGIKGSPLAVKTRPASFFVPVLLFNTNMMEAARVSKVERYLFTSTLGVYAPAKKFNEDDVWKTFPSPNDWYGGWAKRMGELQAEAYKVEHGWDKIAIVRPANVYGPNDNFDPVNSMVIPSLIRRVVEGENPLKVWGDGSEIRDFIHARDVARGMLLAMEKKADGTPINLGSGKGVQIKNLVTTICSCIDNPPKIAWDLSKKSGDKIRVMNVTRAQKIGFKPTISLATGIKETVDWYIANKKTKTKKYNVFHQKAYI